MIMYTKVSNMWSKSSQVAIDHVRPSKAMSLACEDLLEIAKFTSKCCQFEQPELRNN